MGDYRYGRNSAFCAARLGFFDGRQHESIQSLTSQLICHGDARSAPLDWVYAFDESDWHQMGSSPLASPEHLQENQGCGGKDKTRARDNPKKGQDMLRHVEKVGIAALCCFLPLTGAAQTYYPIQELLTTSQTVVGEKIRYPVGTPRISVAVVTVMPGSAAAFHRHPAPLVAYILEGELTVDYGSHGKKIFRQGEAVVEAMDVPHRGFNEGSSLVKLLAVYVGAEGTQNVALEK